MQQQVTVEQALQYSLQMLQSGRVAEAEPILQQILQQFPNHAEAMHGMAFVANARQDHPAAENFLRRAIQINPNVAVYHQNLGVLHAALGRQEPAAESFQRAMQLDPNYAEPVMKFGMILEEKGQLDQAMEYYRRSLALNPNYAEAYCTMGDVYCKQEQNDQALACYEQALRINPNLAEAHANRGTAFNKMGRLDDAIATTARAIQINPNMFHALRAMGIYAALKGDFEQSILYLKRAVEIDPKSALAHSGLAITYLKMGRVEEAVTHCRISIQLDPKFLDPHVNLGLALTDLGEHEEALRVYAQGLSIDPKCDGITANRAIIHLLRGDFEKGFEDYRHRLLLPEFSAVGRDYKSPRWEGQDLSGKTLLIWYEQGFGDAFHFIRYAKFLAARGAKVIAEVQNPIVALMRTVEGVSQVITRDDPVPPVDFHAPILSVPGLVGTRVDTIPAEGAYLHADPALVDQWRLRVDPFAGFRVGIVWHGNPFLRLNYARSLKLAQFAPLARVPGVRFFSLQIGPGAEEVITAPPAMNLINLTAYIRDFSDTAALIQNLDLVIAVDTAVLHLAAALGKPSWLLLQKWPDWRWLLDREDSPWYPTLRIFRQSKRGEWNDVFERVEDELRKAAGR